MDDKKWIDEINRKMEDFEMSPPKKLDEDIERLIRSDLVKPKTMLLYNKRVWAAAAMFAGVLLIGGDVWFNVHQDGDTVSHSAFVKITPKTSSFSCQETRKVLADIATSHYAITSKTTATPHELASRAEINSDSVDMDTSMFSGTTDNSAQDVTKKTEATTSQQSQQHKPAKQKEVYKLPPSGNTLMAVHRSREDQFSVSLTASNLMSSNSQHGGYGELLTGSIWQDNSNEDGREEEASDDFGALEEVIVGNSDRDVFTKKKHHQPVRVGISVNYNLSERLSVGTGLTYSYLSSDLTSGTDYSNYTIHQKLQYIGIPLNVSYVLYQRKRWSVYGTTGAMVEKCIKGKSTTDFSVSGKDEIPQSDDIKERKPQYSVNAAVGVQAKITDRVGVYLEPGISYHFDNHSDVINIYKDTPLNFSLGMGFRYSFK